MIGSVTVTREERMATTNGGLDGFDPRVNQERMGQLIRGARFAAGYSSTQACIDALSAIANFDLKLWTLRAIERGEQLPSLEQLNALALLLQPPGGIHYFLLPCMEAESATRLYKLNCNG